MAQNNYSQEENIKEGNIKKEDLLELQEKLEKITREKEQYLSDLQRARAELINYKKEEEKRLWEVARFSNERIIKELISVLDSFDLALHSFKNQESKDEEKYFKGIYLIKNQIEDLLKREGVEEIITEKGKPPDLSVQEIVAEMETYDFPPETVAEILQKGYILNKKIIRPARVAVVRKKENQN